MSTVRRIKNHCNIQIKTNILTPVWFSLALHIIEYRRQFSDRVLYIFNTNLGNRLCAKVLSMATAKCWNKRSRTWSLNPVSSIQSTILCIYSYIHFEYGYVALIFVVFYMIPPVLMIAMSHKICQTWPLWTKSCQTSSGVNTSYHMSTWSKAKSKWCLKNIVNIYAFIYPAALKTRSARHMFNLVHQHAYRHH